MTIKAVLTGDLIHSQHSHDTLAYIEGLSRVLATLSERYGASAETFRGDGFQLVLGQPALAFDCALALRAGLIAASPKASAGTPGSPSASGRRQSIKATAKSSCCPGKAWTA